MTSPILAVDHLLVDARDFERSRSCYTALLGGAALWEGRISARRAALFDGGNLHVLLRDGEGDPGIRGLCLRVDSRERLRRRLSRLGTPLLETHAEDPLAALLENSGGIDCGDPQHSRGLPLYYVARGAAAPPRSDDDGQRTPGLDHLVVSSGDARASAFLFAAQLGLDLRLDMQRPQWGGRFLFFRCGDLIIEVISSEDDRNVQMDQYYGLSWRMRDAGATHRRLREAGLDLSGIRDGRRPGTRVFSVHDPDTAVPTLMIEPPP